MPIWGHGRNVGQRSANVTPFYAVVSRQIDAVWGWNGNSAAKVVHFRYTAYRFSAALGAYRIAIGSSTVVGRRRQLLPGGDENLEHGHAAVGIIAFAFRPDLFWATDRAC
jgi:hypothetical protein